MASILAEPRVRQIYRRLPLPEIWPLAVVLFMTLCLCLGFGPVKSLNPTVDLPTSSGSGCFPEAQRYNITISKDNKLFFGVEEELYRTAVIEQVAALHGISFTSLQRQELQRLPYMAMDVRRLPEYLSSSRTQRYALLKTGIPVGQLAEYVDATRRIYLKRAGKLSFCFIRADKKITYSAISPVIKLLQQHKINRFNISTNVEY